MESAAARLDASALAAQVSLLVVLAAFVGLLGGTHPSDRGRDLALLLAASTFALLNLPSWGLDHGGSAPWTSDWQLSAGSDPVDSDHAPAWQRLQERRRRLLPIPRRRSSLSG